MRIYPIASGSSGNCIYVGSGSTHILIDEGISKKRIEEGLAGIGLTGDDIDAVLITHEHSDHTQGLGVMSRRYKTPIWATMQTILYIEKDKRLGVCPACFNDVVPDEPFVIGDITVHPFRISHDAVSPVGYRLESAEGQVAVATDMGIYNDYIVNHLKGLDAILIESNHDIRMLETGPYPYPLKRRILSDLGHLSNENCGRLLCEILHKDMKHIILGHLSKENNLPELAYESVRMEINMGDNPFKAEDFNLVVAKRSEPTGVFQI